jgi:hypothetical protein
MNEYVIDSIDLDRCKKTPEIIFKSLILCDSCFKLPIPQYKSYKQQNKTFCRSCYLKNNKHEEVFYPSRLEMNILEQVVINCSNMSCEKVFNINSLNDMIKHEEICGRIKVNQFI